MNQVNNQNQPTFQMPTPKRSPLQVAAMIGMYVQALIKIIFWAVIGAAFLAIGFVALSAIWFVAQIILKAVGLN